MSFGDLERDLPSQPAPTPQRRLNFNSSQPAASSASSSSSSAAWQDQPSDQKLWDRTSQNVFKISNNVSSIQKLVVLLGSKKDTPELRANL
ncbi:hypothetical protein BDK51DRAFT_45243 [Blyttiomyces helicus]|uniref:Syntaxin N-terminal domain-containing protein n=1 Tax=Blyttiomyces helicus TaxID=388810 RepID=A0A4P9VXB8_9FUNG|nr:hypothetical protein BDK51DRAFT_45243 [Blyttiomyces helicus]|eukprot:RKO84354.1 hypothetical protein BDK51DRAFT_45243 [Blyttiomyces helicus]